MSSVGQAGVPRPGDSLLAAKVRAIARGDLQQAGHYESTRRTSDAVRSVVAAATAPEADAPRAQVRPMRSRSGTRSFRGRVGRERGIASMLSSLSTNSTFFHVAAAILRLKTN